MIGGMDEDSNTRKYLSSSIPYYQDDQTWCVATAKPEELWRNIFNLFSTLVWSLIILVVCLMAIMLYFFIKLDKKTENFMWMLLASLSVTMGISTTYDPKNTNTRIIFFIFLFYGLLFSTAFNSFLVGVLTNPRQKEQISDLPQAVASNLEFNGGTVTLEHIDAVDEVNKYGNRNAERLLRIEMNHRSLQKRETLFIFAITLMNVSCNSGSMITWPLRPVENMP